MTKLQCTFLFEKFLISSVIAIGKSWMETWLLKSETATPFSTLCLSTQSKFYLFIYLFIQYFQRVALLASIASLPSGPL